MERYICIHGHFYQPPRENPWLESIELQDSAYPYHDWNERITAECYSPNATSRILDGTGKIVQILNNYGQISHNFGPTLLSWLEDKSPDTYQAIINADKQSQKMFSGHGSAMAQAYNHIILPLADERDKFTQVHWGIRDFEFRYGRKPEGMWVAETAVDVPTLEVLAERGIRFTVLAPHQASRVRKMGARNWKDVSGARIDPTMPYEISLPSGRKMALFFYDGPISRAIAFEHLLNKGESLAERLTGAFSNDRDWPQLVHVATDGETYGHHHRHGDMALAYALQHIQRNNLAKLTNYGEFLEKFKPTHEVEIFENSSWSCVHGVERWKSNCGCNSGMHPGWNQEWRAPLRQALDWLRDTIRPKYEQKASEYLRDPWMARNDYIEVMLDRSPDVVDEFILHQSHRPLNDQEKITVLKLLEIQRHLIYMYTSCGWFFDDVSGIETVQVIQYAGRALQLAEDVFGERFEKEFVDRLSAAKSNVAGLTDGRTIYDRFVKPASMNLFKVGAHYAISSLFQTSSEDAKSYCYSVEYVDYRNFDAGKARLALGKIRITSEMTFESALLVFGIVHLGDHNLNGGVVEFTGDQAYETIVEEIGRAFSKADFPETLRGLDRHFGLSTYSLKSLFKDEQRHILSSILESTLTDAEAVLRQVYENNAPLMRFLADLWVPLPRALHASAEFVLNMNLRHAFEKGDIDLGKISTLLAESREARVTLDSVGLAYALEKTLGRMMDQLWENPADLSLLANLASAAALVPTLPFEVNLWNVQNNYYEIKQRIYPELREKADLGDEAAKAWLKPFHQLGEKLRVQVP